MDIMKIIFLGIGERKDESGWFYCSEKDSDKIEVKHLCFNKIITELKPFIKKEKEKGVFDY